MTNCYKTLGVKDFASAEEIKTAYRKLSKKFHPDHNDGDKFFEECFKEIQNAYEILCNSKRKEIHDNNLRNYFAGSTSFDFKKQPEPERNEQTKASENTNEEKEAKRTSTQTSYNSTTTKTTNKSYFQTALGLFLAIVMITVIIKVSIANREEEDNDDAGENTAQSASNYYSNPSPTFQEQTVQSPAPRSYNNQAPAGEEDQTPAYSAGNNYFTIGSTKNEVLQAQGNPSEINKYEYTGTEKWYYGLSSVTFKNGRVNEYSNSSRNLNVLMTSSVPGNDQNSYFSIGSTTDEVLQVQGNPTEINKYEYTGTEKWYYGLSSVTFKNGRVSEYSNSSRNLSVQMTSSVPGNDQISYFSIGSTMDEVLQAQGNPSEINKYEYTGTEKWYYGLSSVTFEHGRVSEYSNSSRNLNVHLY